METALKNGNQVLAFSGGIGGAKLALGLSRRVPAECLAIVCNTGDDFEHLGLSISPDLDTVMYTLAGINNLQQGWGLDGESWRTMERLAQLGGPDWFRLGDLDLATHLYRTRRLQEGASLTEVTHELCRAQGLPANIHPASDDAVRTIVVTDEGELPFQHYFVREQCRPVVRGLRFHGAQTARPQAEVAALLQGDRLACIVICPSNPFLSIDPMLHIAGMHRLLKEASAPIVAVSPIVGGKALKGPTAKMMEELGMPVTALGIAHYYRGLVNGLVIDEADAEQADAIAALGMAVHVSKTVMTTLDDRCALADEVVRFGQTLMTKVH